MRPRRRRTTGQRREVECPLHLAGRRSPCSNALHQATIWQEWAASAPSSDRAHKTSLRARVGGRALRPSLRRLPTPSNSRRAPRGEVLYTARDPQLDLDLKGTSHSSRLLLRRMAFPPTRDDCAIHRRGKRWVRSLWSSSPSATLSWR